VNEKYASSSLELALSSRALGFVQISEKKSAKHRQQKLAFKLPPTELCSLLLPSTLETLLPSSRLEDEAAIAPSMK
jgi:hypothetical protein